MNGITRQRALLGISGLLCSALLLLGCQDTANPVGPNIDESAFATAGKKGGGGNGGGNGGGTAGFTYAGAITASVSDVFIERDHHKRGLFVGMGPQSVLNRDVTISFPLAQAQSCNASDFQGCGCWLVDSEGNSILATDVDAATKAALIDQLDKTITEQDWFSAAFEADHPSTPTTGFLDVRYTDPVLGDARIGMSKLGPPPPSVVTRLDNPNAPEAPEGAGDDPDDVRVYQYTDGGIKVQQGGGFGIVTLACVNTGGASIIATLTK